MRNQCKNWKLTMSHIIEYVGQTLPKHKSLYSYKLVGSILAALSSSCVIRQAGSGCSLLRGAPFWSRQLIMFSHNPRIGEQRGVLQQGMVCLNILDFNKPWIGNLKRILVKRRCILATKIYAERDIFSWLNWHKFERYIYLVSTEPQWPSPLQTFQPFQQNPIQRHPI